VNPRSPHGEGTEPASVPRASVAPPSGWARRIHRQLGLALVPWMIVGAIAAIAVNHTRGFAAPCDDAPAALADADPAARRAWGHLMAKASLAGERVDLVLGSAEWIASDEVVSAAPADALPRPEWASATRLEGFLLPEGDRPTDARSRLVFLARGEGRLWRCTVELDGGLRVDAHDEDGANLHGSLAPTGDGPWALLVDLVAAAMLLWGAGACVLLWRNPVGRRSGLIALATGAATLAAFVTTIG
jgi:hypothetical protein